MFVSSSSSSSPPPPQWCYKRASKGECHVKINVATNCPEACGYCGTCDDIKSTKWCSKKQAKGKCENKIDIMTNCRQTCGLCTAPPPPPAPCSHALSTDWCVNRQNKCHKKKIYDQCMVTCQHCTDLFPPEIVPPPPSSPGAFDPNDPFNTYGWADYYDDGTGWG